MRERRRRRGQGESGQGNHERWLITYADLITLLMIFFVILYTMSKIDLVRFEQISMSLQSALPSHTMIEMESPRNPDSIRNEVQDDPVKAQEEQRQLDNLKKRVEDYIEENNLSTQVTVLENRRGVQITLSDTALFTSGEALLKPDAKQILGGLAPFLQTVPNEIEVEGHTDDVPIQNAKYASNWELSTQRAVNVLHFFEAAGLPAQRMHAAAFAHTEPLVPNDSDLNRASNRRVNLMILRTYDMESISPVQ